MPESKPIYCITAPPEISATITLPASKSISNRMLILNALSRSPYPIENLSDSDDTQVLLKALNSKEKNLDIGAAGTSMRFLTAYLSQSSGEYTLTGTERMRNRPIGILVDALRQLSADIDYLEKESYPPLRIRGRKLQGGKIVIDGSVSSQYISALLMIAPGMERGLTLQFKGAITSLPYLQMTIRLMETFGVQIEWPDINTLSIDPQTYRPQPFRVESDWSAASYWYEIQALYQGRSRIELLGLEENSVQGDAKAAAIFENLDRHIHNQTAGVFEYDFVNEPDLAQTLTVACCLLDVPFRFTGLHSLRIKETDRISALQTELKKLGYILANEGDHSLQWDGQKVAAEHNPVIATYEDHRMAMAFAPACIRTGSIRIQDPAVVSKSYPNFWKDLQQAGFLISGKLKIEN
ncbi:MAG: 3-phosphoshikimate 1-carboxyvinyltransferase [Dysgonamonadaceae bacterium]|jgi:3-phosphoshikimate 1-carboxyvinyltransferase|nr:3-phosphoshikimate 1-carboxyvinyltransferase [Dysgonamonadaceae bacterium]